MRQFLAGALALIAIVGGATGAMAQTAFAPAAMVNDDVITYYDVERRARLLQISGADAPNQQTSRAALEGLIDDRLRAQAAERAQVAASQDEISQSVAQFGQRFNLDAQALRGRLINIGVEEDTLVRMISAQVAWRSLVNRRFGSRATPSELELDNEIALAASGRSKSFRISELIIAAGEGREEQALARVQQVRREILAGLDFAAAAKRYSDAPSGRGGGDVGWVPSTSLPPALAALIEATPPGGITEPFRAPGGVSIFRVADTRSEAPPFAQDAAVSLRRIRIDGDDDAARAAANELRENTDGCESIPDLSDQMVMDSIDRKLVRELPGPIRGAVQLLQAGQASQPISVEGKTEVFVVRDRTGGVDAETRNRLREQIRNRRLARLAEGYLQDLRREAVIERR